MINYLLEIPISLKEAKRRKFKVEISKLLVSWDDETEKKKTFLKFAELIFSICPQGNVVHAQPINSFTPITEYAVQLEQKQIKYWFDSLFRQGNKKKPFLITTQCETVSNLMEVFSIFQSEGIVFFPSEASEDDERLEKHLLKFSAGNYEIPYLDEINSYSFFVFFAESHMSLEILGSRDAVLNCLLKIIEVDEQTTG